MASREEFLTHLWTENINPCMQEHWIDNVIREAEKDPDAPFSDVGPVLKRLLAAGAARARFEFDSALCRLRSGLRHALRVGDPGVDDGYIEMLHESLLTADPSGREGRPGSAPEKR